MGEDADALDVAEEGSHSSFPTETDLLRVRCLIEVANEAVDRER